MFDYSNFEQEQREVIALQKDIIKARGLIHDAILRYKKSKLKARSKKSAENIKELFSELEQYNYDYREIQEAYGFDCISEKEFDRLCEMLENYKKYIDEDGKFHDRITDMLQYAINCIPDPYRDRIEQYNAAKEAIEKSKREALEREVAYEREKYFRGL